MTEHKNVRTRIAPSPTGEDIHIGNLYTALINYTFAKKMGGSFILRIEDTDRTRLVEGAIEKIISSIEKYGLLFDEGPHKGGDFGPYMQSERLDHYQKYAKQLVESDKAYYCFCSKERLEELKKEKGENTHIRHFDVCSEKNNQEKLSAKEQYVIRLKVPQSKEIVFTDLVRGEIKINSDQIDDQILIKSDGFPTYHMAVVVDDNLMQITHVIRAEEWISSTPKHILLYEALGWELPTFVHLPILRNPDKSKLSKRKNPVWASWYLDEGFLPEAVLNFLALMGWSHPEEKEIFDLEEFIDVFRLEDINPVGPVFDVTKLKWLNQQHIQNLTDEELVERLQNFYKNRNLDVELLIKLSPILKTRMETLKDFEVLTRHFFEEPGKTGVLSDTGKLDVAKSLLDNLEKVEDWRSEEIFPVLKNVLEEKKIRMPVLYEIITGEERGLPLPESLAILGKERTLSRLKNIVS